MQRIGRAQVSRGPILIHVSYAPPVDNTPAPQHRVRFSLRAFVILILVLGLLLGIAVKLYQVRTAAQKIERTKRTLASVSVCLDAYRAVYKEYPQPAETIHSGETSLSIESLQKPLSQFLPLPPEFFRNGLIVDGWGNPLRCRCDDNQVHVWSCGPNGIDETGAGKLAGDDVGDE
jgi:hypothetical protein